MNSWSTKRFSATAATSCSPYGMPKDAGTGEAERATGLSDLPRHGKLLIVLALGVLIAVSYFPATGAGFVWDDRIWMEAEAVREWRGLWTVWFAPQDIRNEAHYWPINYTTFWLEHKLWGYHPLGYHLVNLLLHFANTLLIGHLMARLAVPGAWLIAAVFAVHPLHVESVAWVMGRKDLLSACFYLSAVLGWLRFLEEPRANRRAVRYVLTLALFAAAMLAKSIAVTLPVSLLIGRWWKQGRVTRADLLSVLPFFVMAAVYVLADLSFSRSKETVDFAYSAVDRVLIAAHALWFYVGKLLWPSGLSIIYPHWVAPWGGIRLTAPLAWANVVAAACVIGLLWCARRRLGRGPLAAALFFGVTLAPVLGFIDYGYMRLSFVADRYQYLAGIGLIALFGAAAARVAGGLPVAWRKAATGLALVALVLLGGATWQQSRIYESQITFYRHIIAHNPTARDAQHSLGLALLHEDRAAEALAVLRTALQQRPDNADAHSDTGAALILLNRLAEGESHLLRALELDPNHTSARNNLAELYRRRGESR